MSHARPRVHPRVHAFDRAAESYERGRPGYPGAAVRFLARELGIGPGRTVVELGSGTGKLTRSLLATGAAVVAVEPTAGMRRVFRTVLPSTLVLDATAEAIPLPDGFADAVVAAQAFQWFRTGPALREIARVLRPGGGLALLWNVRLDSTPLSREINGLHRRAALALPPRTRRRWGRRWKRALAQGRHGFRPPRLASFRHAQLASPTAIVQSTLSESAIALRSSPERRRAAAEIRRILRATARGPLPGTVRIPYRTDVYIARRLRREASAP